MALEITGDDGRIPAELRKPNGPFLPTERPVRFVYGMIGWKVRSQVYGNFAHGELRPRLMQAIRRHIMAPATKGERMAQGMVYRSFLGSWDEAVAHFVYCMKSYDWRAYEVELAMRAARSRYVLESVDLAIDLMLEITKHALYPDPTKVRHYDWLGKLSDMAQETRKVYFTYLPEKPSFRWLLMLGQKRGFKRSIVLLHDLLQIAWDSFDGPAPAKPLAAPLEALTGPGQKELVTGSTMFTASTFAKKRGLPVEAGPSMTTVRFCQINNLREKVKNPLKPFREPALDDFERECIIWGLFAYWTLFYQKSFGDAHSFHFINNSATQLGCGLSIGWDYPDLAFTALRLGSIWAPGDDNILTRRLTALENGMDQAMVVQEEQPMVVQRHGD